MKRFSLLFIGLIVSIYLIGQTDLKINKNTIEQYINMNKCPIDTNAKAFYVCNNGKGEFSYDLNKKDFIYRFSKNILLKIIDNEIFKDSTFKILILNKHFDQKEKFFGININVYNLVNDKIEKNHLKRNELDFFIEDNCLWLDNKTLLNICNNGDLVEIELTIPLDYNTSFQNWQFEQTIPVLKSEYITNIPASVVIDYQLVGNIKLDINSTDIIDGPVLYYKVGNSPQIGNITVYIQGNQLTFNPAQPNIIIRKCIATGLNSKTERFSSANYKFIQILK